VAPSSGTGYVKASGTSLSLNGAPFTFTGLNIYDVGSNGGCVPATDLSSDINEIGPGLTVIRTWFFQSWVTTSSGQRDWSAFDNVLAEAAAHGVKVIPTLANEWNYCDGPQKYLGWWQTGYQTTIEPGESTPYLQYVHDIVSRYANNPTIAAWDLVNEGSADNADGTCTESTAQQALRAFTDTVGGLVHSLDPNHLVLMGSISGQCGTNEGDYQTVYASPGTDICDYHDYGYATSPMGNTDPYNGLQVTINRCHADGKPIAVLETGIHWTQMTPATTGERELLFSQKLTAQFSAGVVGELMWDYSPTPQTQYPNDFDIGPSDPAISLIK
jgi:mannan endo-1,4-beta-mannosidase